MLHAASQALRAALDGFGVDDLEATLCGPLGSGIFTMRQVACLHDAGLKDACNAFDACGYDPGHIAALRVIRDDARFLISCGVLALGQ